MYVQYSSVLTMHIAPMDNKSLHNQASYIFASNASLDIDNQVSIYFDLRFPISCVENSFKDPKLVGLDTFEMNQS